MALVVIFEAQDESTRQILVNAIAHYGNCVKLADSSYVVKTDVPQASVYAGLHLHLGPNDLLLVLPLAKPYAGGDRRVREWMEQHLPD